MEQDTVITETTPCYASRTEILCRLRLIKDDYAYDAKKKGTSPSVAVSRCIEELEQIEWKDVMYKPEKSERVISLEPFFENGLIGRDVYRCRRCNGRVGRHSNFCETCGRKLVDPNG